MIKTDPPFALKLGATHQLDQEKLENWMILVTISFTGILNIADVTSDLLNGVTIWHLSGELLIIALSLLAVIILWKRTRFLHSEVKSQRKLIEITSAAHAKATAEAQQWRQETSKVLRGLSDAIDAQFIRWTLSNAEKEVALLLLKGLSLKEIAVLRQVSEKTARSQSFAIYSKSGLASRAELSVFFLEDLMLPISHESLAGAEF